VKRVGFHFHPLFPSLEPGAGRLSESCAIEIHQEYKEMIMTTATANETLSIPRINDTAPDFTAETTLGTIHFHDWIGSGWAVLFSHPKDFTPVCTTELGTMARLQPEFAKRNVKIIGLSVDPVTSHGRWAVDIEETQGAKVNYPMIGDPQLKIAKLYGMLPAESGSTSEGRTAADNATVRTVFVIGPDKKIKLQLSYPMSTGRNFDEILRVIDSIQLTAKHKVSTPANWKQGDDVIIGGNVTNEEAQKLYPGGWKSPKPYLRIVPQPK
jgi:thioredoxin-dependent peroxiredoxin